MLTTSAQAKINVTSRCVGTKSELKQLPDDALTTDFCEFLHAEKQITAHYSEDYS